MEDHLLLEGPKFLRNSGYLGKSSYISQISKKFCKYSGYLGKYSGYLGKYLG
jgi:hypothetical protein